MQEPAKTPPSVSPSLRQRALARRHHLTDLQALSPEQVQHLVAELEIHQTELELQNEDLRRAYEELEQLRNRYLDLYENAPVGYLTLDHRRVVRDANLTAARLLGVARARLIGQPIEHFVDPAQRDTCYLQLRAIMDGETAAPVETEFTAVEGSRLSVWLHVTADAAAPPDAPTYRVTFSELASWRQTAPLPPHDGPAATVQGLHALNGLLPMCAACQRVRCADATWEPVSSFLQRAWGVPISHALCPDCVWKLYPNEARDILDGHHP